MCTTTTNKVNSLISLNDLVLFFMTSIVIQGKIIIVNEKKLKKELKKKIKKS